MQFTAIHPDTLAEIKRDAQDVSEDFATSYAYRNLMHAFSLYLTNAAMRDVNNVTEEMEHLQRRVSRLLAS